MSPADSLLERVRVVLVRPQHPGNIGAAARAMKTMGLADLALVAPQRPLDAQAVAMSAGAEDLLLGARTHDTLAGAIADCTHVAGLSARLRAVPHNTLMPRDWAGPVAASTGGRVAVLFGPERMGLHNDDIDRCDVLVSIPANPDYPSLNLAAAVQVVAYELRCAAGAALKQQTAREPAPHAELDRLHEHLERVMRHTGFLNPRAPRQLLPRLRRLFSRAAPDQMEVNILRGILSSVEKRLPD